LFRKCVAEAIGTAILVVAGCGTAMLVGCDAASGSGYLLTALAFGLALIAAAYSIGQVSGCHINPAVSFGMWIGGRIRITEMLAYMAAQVVGAVLGAGILKGVFRVCGLVDSTGSIGSNGLDGVNGSIYAGLVVEALLTFIFVLLVLAITLKEEYGSVAGIAIGLTLTLVHIFGIGLTGTSVNPARSLGPAILSALTGNTAPIGIVWVFIVGPLVGAALAGFVYIALIKPVKTD